MSAKATAQKTIEAGVETATKTFAEGSERAQDFNEQLTAIVKQAGLIGVDNFEKSVATVADFQKKVAGATGLEWLGSVVEAQAGLLTGLSANAAAMVREVLK